MSLFKGPPPGNEPGRESFGVIPIVYAEGQCIGCQDQDSPLPSTRGILAPLCKGSCPKGTEGLPCPSLRAVHRSIPIVVWSGDTPSGALFSCMVSERFRSPMRTRIFPLSPACPSHPGGPLVRGGRKNGFNHGLPTVRGEVLSPALIACAASGEGGGT